MHFNRQNISNEQLLHFYTELVRPRMIEEKMLVLLRQGRISKWFSGIGQEAIAAGRIPVEIEGAAEERRKEVK